MDWLLEPFTCSARMKTSPTEMVLGTGLGDTGTRSVAAAVDALGIPTCHRTYTTADLLLNSTRYDFSAFERTGARAYFDTPMAFLWPRLACAYPNYKIVHTAAPRRGRRPRRGFMTGFMPVCDGEGPWAYSREQQASFCRVCSSARRGKMMMSYCSQASARRGARFLTHLSLSRGGRVATHLQRSFFLASSSKKLDSNSTPKQGHVVAESGARRLENK